VISNNLARKNLEKRLAPLRKADLMPPSRGWLRAIREALGMTTKQLGSRIGVVPSRITALEKAEVTGGTTLKSLREAAEAMGCTLIYAIVPTRPMDDLLRERASALASEELARTNHTMRLEDQALDADDYAAERERLIALYMEGSTRRLWDHP
jgi:predicted DNA-binding mobile mystery protein A